MSTQTNDSKAMPPPPEPNRPSQTKILQPEFEALTRCLQDAIVKTGQIYSFYVDAHKLGIEKHVSNPPRSLTAALGRDIERYDQLCDSIEAHLLRAINVLKRDLRREEQRIEEEEKRKNAEALMLPPPLRPTPSEPATEDVAIQPPSESDNTNPKNSPIITPTPGRRPSAISISSLHRPQFPLKLDLSSTSLRITEEEAAMFSKGLASPVTLAPKSARPVGADEFPPDFMATFATSSVPPDVVHGPPNIDLTLPDALHIPQKQPDMSLDVGIGDTSDKPIELDLDAMDIEMNMTDLFGDPAESGDSNDAHDGLFSPALAEGASERPQGGENSQTLKEDRNTLSDFDMDSNVNDDLFGDFTSGPEVATAGTSIMPESTLVPSPNSLLAQFSSTSDLMDVRPSPSANPSIPDNGENFDLDSLGLAHLEPNFFANAQDSEMNFPMDMETFLNMNSNVEEKGDGGASNQNIEQG